MAIKSMRPRLPPIELFVSYAHEDEVAAKRIVATLTRHNVRTWFSVRNITGAQQWQDEIGNAHDRCDWFLVLLTPAAVESMWVKRELAYVLGERRYEGRIIPLLLKDCSLRKLSFTLTTLQIIPFRHPTSAYRALLDLWGMTFRAKD